MIVGVDLGQAVELAPRVWWVGSMLPGDEFQCHVYLIEQGDQSVLIDPGSALTADEVVRKVNQVVGLDHVRWVVCSHADPDILGAIPTLLEQGLRADASIVTHWRDAALIRHGGWSVPFWKIEEHDWTLVLEDRRLRFVFTPYAHFAGAFCTFDEGSGTLFSSDLFGAFTDDTSLFASSMDCFDGILAFHEHYMPSKEALNHSLEQFVGLPIHRVAPQHGQVIPEALVVPIMERLRTAECGLYLLAHDDPGLEFLFMSSRTLHEITESILDDSVFAAVAGHLSTLAGNLLGARSVEFWAQAGDVTLCFTEADGYTGRPAVPSVEVAAALKHEPLPDSSSAQLVVPLICGGGGVSGVAVVSLSEPVELDQREHSLLDQVAELVGVAIEREVARRVVELDRATLYTQATHDSLTGLYNRMYLADVAARMCSRDERGESPAMAALMIDIDHFKLVNDRFGHQTGDAVLHRVATTIAATLRGGDLAVRYGGEEFLVVLADIGRDEALAIAERIRRSVADQILPEPVVTVSVGVAMRQQRESFDALVARADQALYEAKSTGRDKVDVAA